MPCQILKPEIFWWLLFRNKVTFAFIFVEKIHRKNGAKFNGKFHDSVLPEESRKVYISIYDAFIQRRVTTTINSFSDSVLSECFNYKIKLSINLLFFSLKHKLFLGCWQSILFHLHIIAIIYSGDLKP